MAFNINQRVFDADGMPREKIARQYQEQLVKLFEESPEGQALREAGIEPGWADLVIGFGMDYLSVTPAQMSSSDLREILFDLFPRKVSAEPHEAPDVIRELQAFWAFLQREFHLANAAACLKVLDDKAAHELKKAMGNPANFGIAKSFIMMGMERGADMGSEEGINEWMKTYNAEIAAGTGLRIPLPGEQSADSRKVHDKLKRKMVSDSRKKNRKRK